LSPVENRRRLSHEETIAQAEKEIGMIVSNKSQLTAKNVSDALAVPTNSL
jgi:hypothetical protein